MLWPRLYYFISGLLYPGALGAAMTWFVIGLSSPNWPSGPALLLALWFTVYHSLQFVRLMDRHDNWCSDHKNPRYREDAFKHEVYGLPALVSDILDSLALFVAFGGFGFSGSAVTAHQFAWVFGAAILVPFSAIAAHDGLYKHSDKYKAVRPVLIVATTVLAVFGVLLNRSFSGTEPHQGTSWIIVGLWGCLAVYAWFLYRADP